MNPLIQLKQTTSVFLIAFGLAWFGLSPAARAVTPPPDGGYPNGNTAEGDNALLNLDTSTGLNTAIGFEALKNDTTGDQNTAVGWSALARNTIANFNTAVGNSALGNNRDGANNTATGSAALTSNTHGNDNTANGIGALGKNTRGSRNTAVGESALSSNITGNNNTAIGIEALVNTTGNSNVALGNKAGDDATTGSNNVYIGAGIDGIAGESNACRIGSIFGRTAANGSAVFITSGNKLGTVPSSKRFKENINPMNKASEVIFSLKPVAFRYKKEIDPESIPQFGLVAEDVEKVDPALIVRDNEGKPYSVRYDQVNAMLLNEFLKEHRKVERLEQQVERLTTGLQKVSAQLEANKPAQPVVNNNQ